MAQHSQQFCGHAPNHPSASFDSTYKYFNNTHIETALRKIIRKILPDKGGLYLYL
jgi:hypothetical protein